MLNLGFNVNVDITKARMPIHFERKNICVHCGGDNTLVFVDKFGRFTNKEINAFDHIKCKKCGRIYSIKWDSYGDKMLPSAVEFNISQQFNNFLDRKEIKEKSENELEWR